MVTEYLVRWTKDCEKHYEFNRNNKYKILAFKADYVQKMYKMIKRVPWFGRVGFGLVPRPLPVPLPGVPRTKQNWKAAKFLKDQYLTC